MSEKPLPSTPHLTGCPLHPLHPSETPLLQGRLQSPRQAGGRWPECEMGPFPSRLWGFSLARVPLARSLQDSPRPSAAHTAAADTHLPAPLLLLTLEGNFWGCWKALAATGHWAERLQGPAAHTRVPRNLLACGGTRARRAKASPDLTRRWLVSEAVHPNSQFWLAVSKMPVHLD